MPALDPNKLTVMPTTRLASRTSRVVPVLQVVSVWLTRHRSRRALACLDAHLLRDIGLTAQDASDELRKPLWRP
jgi:uncharacterized protein YjiS (DUF1127 family)